jgi:hypothetical protein
MILKIWNGSGGHQPTETPTQYVAMLVGENENLKQQMTVTDRQTGVVTYGQSSSWLLIPGLEQQQNGVNLFNSVEDHKCPNFTKSYALYLFCFFSRR